MNSLGRYMTRGSAMFNDSTLFLSIKPEFAEKILTGEKRVELRRTRPKIEPGDLILLYATAPWKRVTGYCTVECVMHGRPAHLWPEVRDRCAIKRSHYDAYFCGATTAFGIEVSNPHRFEDDLGLADLKDRCPDFRVPQSYRYVAYLEARLRCYLEAAAVAAIPVPS